MDWHIEHEAPGSSRVPRELRRWRHTLLREGGFGEALADRLACDADYDLHELLSLVDRGCPPDLAARILAPR